MRDPAADRARLAAEIARVVALFTGGPPPPPIPPIGTALDRLVATHGLTPFERDLLLAAVAAELDPRLAPPSFSRALSVLPGAAWAATRADRPLRAARLLLPGQGPLLAAPLHAEERVVQHLQGEAVPDDRLAAFVTPVKAPPDATILPASRHAAAARLAAAWQGPALLHGPDAADLADVAALAVAAQGGALWRLPLLDVPRGTAERDGFARLWRREAALADAALQVECGADPAPEAVAALAALLPRLAGRVAMAARTRLPIEGLVAVLDLPRPDAAEQAALWRRRLDGDAAAAMAAEYDLGHAEILAAPTELQAAPQHARAASRARLRQRLDALAERIEPRATLDDLVLPEPQRKMLDLLAAAAAARGAQHAAGQGRLTARGAGVAALFTGPSGTGKTLAAEAIAGRLGLDLHRVDLAAVVSKWVGETEKHLRALFDAAEQGGSVLLFDEADALFGRRSEVRDSHDRYANLEVSYLLQRIERFRGVALLTTNLRAAMDPAFLRRLRFVIPFPHPDATQREELWRRALPDAPEADWSRLAGLDLTGGEIASVAAHARMLASVQRVPLGMAQLAAAAMAEMVKLERPLAGLEAWA